MKPYNRFNLFFIVSSAGIRKDTHRQFNVARPNLPPNTQLERELILQSNPDYKPSSAELRHPHFVTGYEDVEIPFSLPSRYAQITIPEGWYLPGRNKTRPHTKSKNLIPFTELSKMIARNYKNVDEETFNYLDAISTSMIKRSKELLGSRNSNAHCIQQQVSLSNRTEDEVAPLNHLKSLSFKAQLMQLLPQLQMASAMQRDVVGLNLTYADYKLSGQGRLLFQDITSLRPVQRHHLQAIRDHYSRTSSAIHFTVDHPVWRKQGSGVPVAHSVARALAARRRCFQYRHLTGWQNHQPD